MACSGSATRRLAVRLNLPLAKQGLEWPDQRAQCVLSYFKLSMYYGLQYDPDFCQVRNPANIWALLQLIEMGLNDDSAGAEAEADDVPAVVEDVDTSDDNNDLPAQLPVVDDGAVDVVVPLEAQEVDPSENDAEQVPDSVPEEEIQNILDQIQEPAPQLDVEGGSANQLSIFLISFLLQ
ncbi:hypothetical protein COOONC_23091 [Cooperia oncophora]